MEEYISKSAIVAEIERRKNQFVSQAESFRKIGKKKQESYFAALASNMNSLSCFIDTIEIKEVDLEREVADYVEQHKRELSSGYFDIRRIARHFFVLGLNQKENKL